MTTVLHTSPCPNCGHRTFHLLDDSEHAFIIAANKEDQDELKTQAVAEISDMPITCDYCGYIKQHD
ncbi:MAG: hypothetical protein LBT32_00320 [Peptococcaceae bacterium]|jgi:DNA-directed RNA polymerase subunit RPC12/RpoP|nr:hypothetical protein [Peptococcaceae bacterium]